MTQAERVADLVHRHVLHVAQHELLGLGAARVDVAARFEHVECVAELLGRLVGIVAGPLRSHAARGQLGRQVR